MRYKVGQVYTLDQVTERIVWEINTNSLWVAQWRKEDEDHATLVGFKKYPNGVNHA